MTGRVICDLVGWRLKGEVILVLKWAQWKTTSLLEMPVLKTFVIFEVIHGWFCCLFCKELHIWNINDRCVSFSLNWKFGSKSNLQRCCKSVEILSLSAEQSIVFSEPLHSLAGKILHWLINPLSFATEHTEGTCWWWPKSCHFGCPCGQLAQEDCKGNET